MDIWCLVITPTPSVLYPTGLSQDVYAHMVPGYHPYTLYCTLYCTLQVYHKMSATSHIKMRQVLLAIAETAFVASPYPVVLSLEMHCSLPQQESTLPSYHPIPHPRDALLT